MILNLAAAQRNYNTSVVNTAAVPESYLPLPPHTRQIPAPARNDDAIGQDEPELVARGDAGSGGKAQADPKPSPQQMRNQGQIQGQGHPKDRNAAGSELHGFGKVEQQVSEYYGRGELEAAAG